MADKTVAVKEENVAKVAYDMARDLWLNEYQEVPKASDSTFIGLVAACAGALKAHTSPYESLVNYIAKNFPKN
ncbi:hypothetical protein [Paracoccus sp. TOH]|uniref:hypothetical protein n=1 Tax=Paracoccus sp. TOH TaxID=1263728 RepID=UPI0025AFDD89|nr:hypothetical protein [Paracoccus sp. TOH]WJS83535.1 hypothetical protein NBE95_07060 [Paracoccus sp. TOH]